MRSGFAWVPGNSSRGVGHTAVSFARDATTACKEGVAFSRAAYHPAGLTPMSQIIRNYKLIIERLMARNMEIVIQSTLYISSNRAKFLTVILTEMDD